MKTLAAVIIALAIVSSVFAADNQVFLDKVKAHSDAATSEAVSWHCKTASYQLEQAEFLVGQFRKYGDPAWSDPVFSARGAVNYCNKYVGDYTKARYAAVANLPQARMWALKKQCDRAVKLYDKTMIDVNMWNMSLDPQVKQQLDRAKVPMEACR